MAGFMKVGRVEEFSDGRGRAVSVDGKTVAVFRRGERFFAVGDRCPHMGASLADGEIVEDEVQCSWHGWRFHLGTGRSQAKEWACVPVYEVRVEGGDVLVAAPEVTEEKAGTDDGDWFVWDPKNG